jgi:hypothetical protein
MPVVIKDFEVVGNGNGSQEPAATTPSPQPTQRPLSARQVAQMMKYIKERAMRLHAD